MTVRAHVDPELCIGSGSCVRIAPDSFVLDDEGVADVTETGETPDDLLRQAARSCPTGAIALEE